MNHFKSRLVLLLLLAAATSTAAWAWDGARGYYGYRPGNHQDNHGNQGNSSGKPQNNYRDYHHEKPPVYLRQGYAPRPHTQFRVIIGPPVYQPWHYYPAPRYYYYGYYVPPVIVTPAPSSPPQYIEQGTASQPAQDSQYWYYCKNPEGYYPYVKECPEGWQKVLPHPPPG